MSMAGRRAIGEAAIQVDFHVAGALELFEDDVVHAAAGCRSARWAMMVSEPPIFDVIDCGCKEETARALQSVGVNTSRRELFLRAV